MNKIATPMEVAERQFDAYNKRDLERPVPNETQHFLEFEAGMEMLKIPCEWKKVEAFKWVENISPRKADFLLRNG